MAVNLDEITVPYDQFYNRRVEIIRDLFERDPRSIDAVVLAGTALTSLATWRYDECGARGCDQKNFERLLLEYWAGYDDRVSIPEALRWLEDQQPNRQLINAIARKYPVRLDMTLRSVVDDPTRQEWSEWIGTLAAGFTRADAFSYARLLFRQFRNSVQHRLLIADGREAFALGRFESPFFYTNHGLAEFQSVHGIRFGFRHRYLEHVLRDVVIAMRAWAVANRRNIFDLARLR